VTPGPLLPARFFRVLVLALLVEVSVVLLFPAAVVFKRLVTDGHGLRALLAIFTFAAIVRFGVAYGWRDGGGTDP
jgi:NADH:ubiquinone oxidoreductase subunit 3 (subunit A)